MTLIRRRIRTGVTFPVVRLVRGVVRGNSFISHHQYDGVTHTVPPDIVEVDSSISSASNSSSCSGLLFANGSMDSSDEVLISARTISSRRYDDLNQPNCTTTSTATDPYYDVRARLETLSTRDRDRARQHHAAALHSIIRAPVVREEEMAIPSWFVVYSCYLGYTVLFLLGHVRECVSRIIRSLRGCRSFFFFFQGSDNSNGSVDVEVDDIMHYPSDDTTRYAALLKGSWEHFFACHVYRRVQDCFNRPIASPPGTRIAVLERISTNGQKTMQLVDHHDHTVVPNHDLDAYVYGDYFESTPEGHFARSCLNLGSYNYLGFANDDWPVTTCGREVMATLADFPVSTASSLHDSYGRTVLHRDLEARIAAFIGKDDALCLNMGFNTNQTVIPHLVGPGDLVLSDALNHSSIVQGARASGAAIRVFAHNDMQALENSVREAIIVGRPRLRRPWNKIIVIVEGIYSMEGECCDLSTIVLICKRYGVYLFLDEAHSIGAMGATGRGCSEYAGVDPRDIDIMMGTFTKSFGAMGGYIAANKETISFLRKQCAGSVHHNAMSPIVCQQIISALTVICGEDGTNRGKEKLRALRDNTNYFRMRLKEMGLIVLGKYDSPVVPVMIYNLTKMGAFSRECFKRGLAVVVVGFPAVPVLMARVRFCISAGHTRMDLDQALRVIDEVADICQIRFVEQRSKVAS